jgi:hypothetical protein
MEENQYQSANIEAEKTILNAKFSYHARKSKF